MACLLKVHALALVLMAQADDPIGRLIDELKGPSRERQEMARVALRAYGALAAERLKKADLDASFVSGVPAAGPEDAEIVEKLKSIRITMDMQNASLPKIADYLREITGVKFVIDDQAIPNAENEIIAIKVADIVLDGALKLLLAPREKVHVVRGGMVILTTPGGPFFSLTPPARAPVRVRANVPAARRHVEGLGSDSVEERERSVQSLARLGFAAEPALWEALGSSNAEARARAGDLLYRLYTPSPKVQPEAAEAKLKGTPVACSFEASTLADMLGPLGEQMEISLVLDPGVDPPDRTVTFKARGLTAEVALQLLMSQFGLRSVIVDNTVMIVGEKSRIVRTRREGPTWLAPEEARKLEALIAALASADSGKQGKSAEELARIGLPALGPLREAADILEGAAAARCRAVRARIADGLKSWLVDEPSGADLQTPTDSQRKILEMRVSSTATGETLEEFLGKQGVRCVMRERSDRKLYFSIRDLSRKAFLKAVTRSHGLDFYMDGETVVVDTAANVRPAVEK